MCQLGSMAQELEWEMFWMQFGACKDAEPGDMFPSDGSGTAKAKRICNSGGPGGAPCIVRKACLMYALEQRIDHGVWGGTSERQRKKMRKPGATGQD